MEENEIMAVEGQEQAPDVESLWDGIETDTGEQTSAPEEPAAETSAEGGQGEKEPVPGEQTGARGEESFKLTYMQQERQVGRDEVIKLAQQGMDYERIRTERDQLRQYRNEADPALSLVKTFAEQSGMTVEAYIDYCRQQSIMATGVNEQTAKAQVEVEKKQVEIARQQAQKQAEENQRSAIQQRAQQRAQAQRRDMEAFLDAYPEVKAETIPPEVWEKVSRGESLVNAYTMHQNQQLKAQIAAASQNRQNAERAPGSMTTQGESGRKSISDLWDEVGG